MTSIFYIYFILNQKIEESFNIWFKLLQISQQYTLIYCCIMYINTKHSSAHGSFIGSIKLEPQTPKQMLVDQSVHFGASSRTYTLRERPQGTQALYSIQGENKQLQELLGWFGVWNLV